MPPDGSLRNQWDAASSTPAQGPSVDSCRKPGELSSTVFENPRADPVKSCSLTSGEFAQLSSNLERGEECRLEHSEQKRAIRGVGGVIAVLGGS